MNRLADDLIRSDRLILFLRSLYGIATRRNRIPKAPKFHLAIPGGGALEATLLPDGPVFKARLPPKPDGGLAELGQDQEQARLFFSELLGEAASPRTSIELAQAAQRRLTPPWAWSRFMAKVGLACGREAYGNEWLDTSHARLLSHDALTRDRPRFVQRTHHPPVERAWPYEPPRHQLWIDSKGSVAVLVVALFGQVLGAVPLHEGPHGGPPPRATGPSAWSLDPEARTFHRSTYPAILLANAALRVQEAGGTVVSVAHPDYPFIFTRDGPDGPIQLGVPTPGADSPMHAFGLARELHEAESAAESA